MNIVVPFTFVHRFAASPDRVVAAMFDPALPERLQADHPMIDEAHAQQQCEEGAVVHRTMRLRARTTIEKIGPKSIPKDVLSYVEESTFDRALLSGSFESRSTRPRLRDRVVHRGTTTLRPVDGGTERRIEGTLEVRDVPLMLRPLAALVRRLFQSEAGRLLDFEARCIEGLLELST